jgi:hypothetical protein
MKVHGKGKMVPEEKFPLQSVASRNMQGGELCGTNISSAKGCEPPLTTILSPKNVELGHTFNNVIEKARTPYVMWISSALPLCQLTTSIAHQQGAYKLPSNL